MADPLFRLIAEHFPTQRMGDQKWLASLWRVLFYLFRPGQPFILKTRDYRLYADPRKGTLTRSVIRRGYWEQVETEAFIGLLRPGALVIDAGANFGHYALSAANLVGPDGLVVAFEPHPDAFALLEANRDLLPLDNLVAVPVALGAGDGTKDLHSDLTNKGGASFYSWNVRVVDGAPLPVSVRSLDQYLSESLKDRPVEVIKIDVQGFEMEVLRGAARTIERDHPAVLCEVTPDALSRAGSGVEELLEFFSARRYGASVEQRGEGRFQALGWRELANFIAQSDAEYHDVLFQAD